VRHVRPPGRGGARPVAEVPGQGHVAPPGVRILEGNGPPRAHRLRGGHREARHQLRGHHHGAAVRLVVARDLAGQPGVPGGAGVEAHRVGYAGVIVRISEYYHRVSCTCRGNGLGCAPGVVGREGPREVGPVQRAVGQRELRALVRRAELRHREALDGLHLRVNGYRERGRRQVAAPQPVRGRQAHRAGYRGRRAVLVPVRHITLAADVLLQAVAEVPPEAQRAPRGGVREGDVVGGANLVTRPGGYAGHRHHLRQHGQRPLLPALAREPRGGRVHRPRVQLHGVGLVRVRARVRERPADRRAPVQNGHPRPPLVEVPPELRPVQRPVGERYRQRVLARVVDGIGEAGLHFRVGENSIGFCARAPVRVSGRNPYIANHVGCSTVNKGMGNIVAVGGDGGFAIVEIPKEVKVSTRTLVIEGNRVVGTGRSNIRHYPGYDPWRYGKCLC